MYAAALFQAGLPSTKVVYLSTNSINMQQHGDSAIVTRNPTDLQKVLKHKIIRNKSIHFTFAKSQQRYTEE